jgi:hypothetical protein
MTTLQHGKRPGRGGEARDGRTTNYILHHKQTTGCYDLTLAMGEYSLRAVIIRGGLPRCRIERRAGCTRTATAPLSGRR